jgi:LysM repeat protein
MKVSKIFGCVLSLHICVIAVLLVQSGCQSSQPPTQTHTQTATQTASPSVTQTRAQTTSSDRVMRSNVEGASRVNEALIPATRRDGAQGLESGRGLDSAFNAGFDDEPTGLEPIEPIEPIQSTSGGQTVDVEGPGFETYTVKKGDSLWAISKRYGVSVNELYSTNGLNKNSVLRVGQQIEIPVEGSTATVNAVTPETYQPSGYNQATTSYTVKRGDNLSKIANQYNTTVRAIKAANGKTSDMIRVGETLTIPVEEGVSSGARSSSGSASATSGTASASGSTQTHTVRSGEYPAKIARQYGMTTSELLAMNGISDPRKLRVGQELTVSGSGSAANVDSRVETVERSAPAQTQTVAPARPAAQASGTEPVEIRVIEADPLVEGELDEEDPDEVFNNAVEIPVIRMEDE